MPCYDPRDSYDYAREEFKGELDKITDLLCKAGRAFKAGRRPPKDVLDWWDAHEKIDERRGRKW